MLISSVFTLISLLALGIGSLLNGLEIWLIVFHSPKGMRVYSQILLQISAADVLTLIITPLNHPVIYSSNVASWELLLGPVKNLPKLWQNIAYMFGLWLYCVSVETLAVEFVYRYLVLNKNRPISFKQYLCMLSVGPCLTSLLLVLAFELVSFPGKHCEYLSVDPEAVLMFELSAEIELASCTRHPNIWEGITYLIALLNVIIVYTIILILGHRMWSYLHKHFKTTAQNGIRSAQKATELDRQITINLIAKATIPVISLSLSVVMLIILFFVMASSEAKILPFWSGQICRILAVYSLPILDPIVTILTVQSYRENAYRLIRNLWSKKRSAISPSNNENVIVVV